MNRIRCAAVPYCTCMLFCDLADWPLSSKVAFGSWDACCVVVKTVLTSHPAKVSWPFPVVYFFLSLWRFCVLIFESAHRTMIYIYYVWLAVTRAHTRTVNLCWPLRYADSFTRTHLWQYDHTQHGWCSDLWASLEPGRVFVLEYIACWSLRYSDSFTRVNCSIFDIFTVVTSPALCVLPDLSIQ